MYVEVHVVLLTFTEKNDWQCGIIRECSPGFGSGTSTGKYRYRIPVLMKEIPVPVPKVEF